MPIQILMPALSPTMTEGNLVKWLKKEGDAVKAGEVIAEIETDKATMEVEAVDEGTLGRIMIAAGTEGVAVNTLIALILEDGEDAATLNEVSVASTKPMTEAKPVPVDGAKKEAAPQSASQPTETSRIFASPLARRLADQSQIDLRKIPGSGPRGRVVKSDIEAAITKRLAASAPTAPMYEESGYVDMPLNAMRKIIAKRLTESKQEIPHFYLTVDCTLDAVMALRAQMNQRLEAEGQGEKLSVNDFIIRAVALSLQQVPEANVSWMETALRQYQSADVAVAVAIDGGLVTPIIRAAEHKTLRQLSAEMKALAAKARAGKLSPQEFQGGSFTISNLGMYGIKDFGAIINPPQACILAVGMGEQRAVVRDGQIEIATQMTCTLSVDHRAVDGAVGSKFLGAFKELIEDPLRLVM
jgi:pyruvate dehydrogenase E2 component (dihydrolipoamide acetyltransferase)